ncbi:DNA polymerase III subunit gamma/tau [Atopomonas sediminilitoris]|uniref:DNA polymerase III subunit gamma/tau n=1 Tax=Atopomonas sediminilitoris TaxID=2919919 RepID=UPI001F4E9543|nr:DNA polymerase III subunit gamma/tau [Atopomonas sediminilitoris]MCJ8167895.1 DNA polymerase III subunit gamma/tau [Atopomonas sediminilitoris]
MSYQVLARKWRPRSFREMVGQTHVLKALINALDSQRLHHAYLFTGTRGVGKTTISRILAKCLNCETGVSSKPCGECSICREIDEGRFVDLIEVDAASRTKVEDTRELLENVQYAPSRGRYKVYLIDEVHMLSTHSFNALLKTLEEPPPHVKFLLATTDPQKLPVTILSRCLQFSLKNMPPERVVEHLAHVLSAENVPFEDDALWQLGRAADGSMRDAMSLTDQAIAFGEGKVLADDVRAMLGNLDHGQVYRVLQALVSADAKALLAAIAHLAEQGPDWAGVLAEILNVLHRVAVAQLLPDAVDNAYGDREQVLAMAQHLPAEDVQFYYQVALLGRRDLPLAPDARAGFEMVMLRMLAFRPAQSAEAPPPPQLAQPVKPEGGSAATTAPQAPVMASAAAPLPPTAPNVATESSVAAPAPVDLPWQTSAQPKPAAEVINPSEPQAAAEPAQLERVAPLAEIAVEPALQAPAATPTPAPLPEQSTADIAPDVVEPIPEHALDPAPVSSEPAPLAAAAEVPSEPEPAMVQAMASNFVVPDIEQADTDTDDGDVVPEAAPLGADAYFDSLPEYAEDDEPTTSGAFVSGSAAQAQLDELASLPPATGLAAEWLALCPQLGLSGLTLNIADNCTLVAREGARWSLQLDPGQSALYNETQRTRLADALSKHLGHAVELVVEVCVPAQETPAKAKLRGRAQRQLDAELEIAADPLVQQLVSDFAAVVIDGSIEPIH